MNSFSIINEARSIYTTLHQSTEMNECLEFLMEKNLNGFIEVGSANGASFHCWGRAIPTGPKISVDWNFGFGLVQQDNSIPFAKESDYPVIQHRNNLWRSHFSEVHTIDGDSRSPDTIELVRTVLKNTTVDWIFIDAWHEYDAAMADYNNYVQFLSPNGFMGFHDIYQSESMKQFWNEIKTKHNSVEFADGTGLGILSNSY